MNTILRSLGLVVTAAVAFAGCRAPKDKAPARESAANASAGSLEGPRRGDSAGSTSGMGGAQMMPGMMGARMMDSMQAQMRSMDAMSPERLKTMVPMHRQMVANML